MKKGKWTIVPIDKKIIKQYGDGAGIGYDILNNDFWTNNVQQDIHAIQYTGDSNDFNQVEYNDGKDNDLFTGNIKIFADEWDKEHLKQLQYDWDNNFIYETIPNPNPTPGEPGNFKSVKIEETVEQKTNRIGPRISTYSSEDIY